MGEPVEVEFHSDRVLPARLLSMRRAPFGTREDGRPAGGLSLVKPWAAGGPK